MTVYGTFTHVWGDPAALHITKRAHKMTRREMMAQQIEAVESGKDIVFQLGKIYIKPYITVHRNEAYPVKGKRYSLFQEARGEDGLPGGKRGGFWDTNNAAEISKWVLEREGSFYKN